MKVRDGWNLEFEMGREMELDLGVVRMSEHFSKLATSYRFLRVTDLEPVMFIKTWLGETPSLEAVDVGCGAGRYCSEFLKHLDIRHLTCVDSNEAMLRATSDYLRAVGAENFSTLRASAEDLPMTEGSIDCIFSFNAIHHFDGVRFLDSVARVMKEGGHIFVYTRLRNQNARTIWGMYFPLFEFKETRLYQLYELEELVKSTGLAAECVERFRYQRVSSLERLVGLARRSHYSTFALYGKEAFDEAIELFQKNIKEHFSDLEKIEWIDENILLILRKGGRRFQVRFV